MASVVGEIGREASRRVGDYVRPRIRSIGVPLPKLETSLDHECGPYANYCNPGTCAPPGYCGPSRDY